MHRLLAALAAASILICAPAAAQGLTSQPTGPENDRIADWLLSVSDALAVGGQGLARLGEAKPLMDGIGSPVAMRQALPKIRALLDDARRSVRRSEAMLASLSPLNMALGPELTAEQVVSDARAQTMAIMVLLTDFDAMLVAMETGDTERVETIFPKVARGGFLLFESNGLILRNRQAGIGKEESSHQALGIAVQIYRAMGEAGQAWVAASLDKRPEEAAARLRGQLVAIAQESRALATAGRVNLSRELSEIDDVLGGAVESEARGMLERTRDVMAAEEKVFALADDLARLAEAHAGISGATLGRQSRPELLGALVPLEARFHEITQAQARAAGQAIR